jgi:hypothetical protein
MRQRRCGLRRLQVSDCTLNILKRHYASGHCRLSVARSVIDAPNVRCGGVSGSRKRWHVGCIAPQVLKFIEALAAAAVARLRLEQPSQQLHNDCLLLRRRPRLAPSATSGIGVPCAAAQRRLSCGRQRCRRAAVPQGIEH